MRTWDNCCGGCGTPLASDWVRFEANVFVKDGKQKLQLTLYPACGVPLTSNAIDWSGGSDGAAFIADGKTIGGKGTEADKARVLFAGLLSSTADNALTAKEDGLYAAEGQGGGGGTVKTDEDTLAGDGSAGTPLRVVLGALLSTAADNALIVKNGKLWTPFKSGQTSIVTDYSSIIGQGIDGSPLKVSPWGLVKQDPNNAIQIVPDPTSIDSSHISLFVPKSSGGLDSVAVSDTADIALSGTGAAATPLTAALTAAVKGNIQQGVDAKSIADAANKTALDTANQVNGKLNNDFSRGDGKDFEVPDGYVLTFIGGKAAPAKPTGGEAAIDQTARDAAAKAQTDANAAKTDASNALGTANQARTNAAAAQTTANTAKTTADAAKAQTDKLKALAFKDKADTADIVDNAITIEKLKSATDSISGFLGFTPTGFRRGQAMDLISGDEGNALKSGTDQKIMLNPGDLISKDAGNTLTQGADGRLKASGGDFIDDIVVINN